MVYNLHSQEYYAISLAWQHTIYALSRCTSSLLGVLVVESNLYSTSIRGRMQHWNSSSLRARLLECLIGLRNPRGEVRILSSPDMETFALSGLVGGESQTGVLGAVSHSSSLTSVSSAREGLTDTLTLALMRSGSSPPSERLSSIGVTIIDGSRLSDVEFLRGEQMITLGSSFSKEESIEEME